MTPEQLERRRASERRYRAKNRELCKERIRECNRRKRAENPELAREQWRDAARKHRIRHPESGRASKLRRAYGITLEEYDAILAAQGGHCAVCDRVCEDNGMRLAVDHDHATGRVRGILCGEHNRMLGENVTIEILARLIEYLSKQV
jgi:hypothetical protein